MGKKGKKVKLAIFDNDLKARTVGLYDVSEDGQKIRVKAGGEAHFMPAFDNDSFIEFERRRFFPPWSKEWEKVYFVKKGTAKCVDFKTGVVGMPNPEQVKQAISSTLLNELGKDEPPFPTWIIYLILACVIGIVLKVYGVIV